MTLCTDIAQPHFLNFVLRISCKKNSYGTVRTKQSLFKLKLKLLRDKKSKIFF